jgi:glycosyltransferase involved in cell wall biosynthesis
MKLLVITPSHVYPPVKGYQVLLCRHIEQLATRHSIDLITFGNPDDQSSSDDPIKLLCHSFQIVPLPKWKIALNLLSCIFTLEPFQIGLYRSEAMTAAVENQLRYTCYDAVICQLTRTVQFLPKWYEGTTLLNMVDPLVLNYSRSLPWQPWHLRFALKHEIARLLRYELHHALRFSGVTLISQTDVSDYKMLLNEVSFKHVTYGIDTVYFNPDISVDRVPGMIIISGNMGYAPNVDGVRYFCKEVFPLILAQVPDATLWLVGARPSTAIQKLANGKNIKVTGYVEDVRYYLCRSMVSVCPIRLNVGTQTKVLEALATGTPVVTTSAGNQGVGCESGYHLWVADTPDEIANCVVRLLNRQHWDSFSENGRQFVQEHFQWVHSAEALEAILIELVAKSKGQVIF